MKGVILSERSVSPCHTWLDLASLLPNTQYQTYLYHIRILGKDPRSSPG